MDKITDTQESDVWTVFFWGLAVCIVLGTIVYFIG